MAHNYVTLPKAQDNITISMWMCGPVPEKWHQPRWDMIPLMLLEHNVAIINVINRIGRKRSEIVGYHIFLEEMGHRFTMR